MRLYRSTGMTKTCLSGMRSRFRKSRSCSEREAGGVRLASLCGLLFRSRRPSPDLPLRSHLPTVWQLTPIWRAASATGTPDFMRETRVSRPFGVSILNSGVVSPEGGVVLDDEEYKGQCRITRERCEKYDAITCGVYGGMVHTAFSDQEDSLDLLERMKADLKQFIDADIEDFDDELAFFEKFVDTYR